MSIRTNILLRIYLAFGLILLFAGAVAIQMVRLQFVQGKKWKAMSVKLSTRYIDVPAARGNIVSADGSLLATSVPQYDVHMDMLAGGIADDKVFYAKIDSLAAKLSGFFGDRSAKDYSRILRNARNDSSRYQLIHHDVSYQQLKTLRSFPIFSMGKYKGGLITVEENRRLLPFRTLAMRTIGYQNITDKNKVVSVGLEGAYANYITGVNGKRLMQRTVGGTWIPVNDDDNEVPTKDGADIISTIDVNMQDIAEDALRAQLDSSQADHGCVVLMEVATGEVKAIANFTHMKDGSYKEVLNYAVGYATEPGSTFKLATYMTLLDQHKIDTSSRMDCEGGKSHVIPGNNKYTVTDVEENNVMSALRAFEESSNVAAAKFVYRAYKDNPWEYTDKLYSYHLNNKLDLQIPGEGQPLIKNPKSRTWSKLTLPQMAYGYEEKLTPLQMLAFYNSVANNGTMIAPIFVREIQRMGNTVEQFHARVINPQVCSPQTLKLVKGMLEGVINDGNGKTIIKNKLYSVAGKTGTAQIANGSSGYGANGNKTHQASFCGYFPADKPKYSMIVLISNPTKGSYLAAKVAGPVFRKIADRVYASDLDINQAPATTYIGNVTMPAVKKGNVSALHKVYAKLGIKPLYAANNADGSAPDTTGGIAGEDVSYKPGTVPSVMGMDLSDALYKLGNAGYKVSVIGSGAVTRQSVNGGSLIPRGSKITIELQ
jgi:cell division protein FtsI (penicillin-binding protein 3)